jgi:integrase
MPAAAQSVIHYISELTRTPREKTRRPYSPATLERIIAAIRTQHAARNQPIPETKGARKVVAGYRKRLAEANDPAAQPRKASAALPAVLARALGHLDRDTLKGKRDAALLLLGFACAARASELVALDIGSVTEPAEVEDIGVKVRIYRKKIKKWQSLTIKYGANPATCPVRAVRALVAALAHEGHTAGPLFVRIDRWGYLAPPMFRDGKPIGDPSGRMTTEAASDVVELAMARIGQAGRWRSHSLRRGFVNAANQAKADPLHTSRHGGWADKSKAFQGYQDEDEGLGDKNPLTNIGL